MQALELKRCGWKQKDIAEALGVTRGAVSQWLTLASTQGDEALLARPRPGASLRLTTEDRQRLPSLLAAGAEAYGFRGQLWTCARVAAIIRQEFGVSYHKAHVSRILKELAWTPQKPIERASQRNEEKIAGWRKEVWPELKKKPVWSGAKSCWWTKPVFICCQPW